MANKVKNERGILIMVFIHWTAQEIWYMEESELEKQRINNINPEILKKFQKNNAYLQRYTTSKIKCCRLIPCS